MHNIGNDFDCLKMQICKSINTTISYLFTYSNSIKKGKLLNIYHLLNAHLRVSGG